MDRLTWWGEVATSDLTHETKQKLLDSWEDLGDGLRRRATDGLEDAIERGWLRLEHGRWRPSTPEQGPAKRPDNQAPTVVVDRRRAAHEVAADEVCDQCPLLAYIRAETGAGEA